MFIKIECDKRIKRLNIEFDDGFETEIDGYDSKEEIKKEFFQKEKVNRKSIKNEPKLNTSDDFETIVPNEVVEKPVIEEKERAPLVAQEMQNLEF